jgi:hypothetical protein
VKIKFCAHFLEAVNGGAEIASVEKTLNELIANPRNEIPGENP